MAECQRPAGAEAGGRAHRCGQSAEVKVLAIVVTQDHRREWNHRGTPVSSLGIVSLQNHVGWNESDRYFRLAIGVAWHTQLDDPMQRHSPP